ncbi:hypothetical protein ADUPG1_014165 [Aduncisulcus paluster]|uniref:Uncharacterized protein n=1 Tax=Aduncisulcus paluster TaxID=2918883 RepID=A0ABQ5KEC2_9EUKA|nr:hypothetical protein ADUPG1_014165 [Aduncisulcus paluster]
MKIASHIKALKTPGWHNLKSLTGRVSPLSRYGAGPLAMYTPTDAGTSPLDSLVFLFGGYNEKAGYLNDLHIYKVSTGSWIQVQKQRGITSWPCVRRGHSTVCVDDDIVVIGGDTGKQCLNDTWIFSIYSFEWEKISTVGDIPSPRYYHTMVSVGPSTLILFGGSDRYASQDHSKYYNDTFIFDTVSGAWRKISYEGIDSISIPCPRYGHSMCMSGDRVVMFGGYGGYDGETGSLNDLWEFDLVEERWICLQRDEAEEALLHDAEHDVSGDISEGKEEKISSALTSSRLLPPSESRPVARTEHTLCGLDDGRVVLFGGCGETGLLGDTWMLTTIDGGEWLQISTAADLKRSFSSHHIPSHRHAASSCYFPALSTVILYGGIGTKTSNEVWGLSLADLHKHAKIVSVDAEKTQETSNSPSGRKSPSISRVSSKNMTPKRPGSASSKQPLSAQETVVISSPPEKKGVASPMVASPMHPSELLQSPKTSSMSKGSTMGRSSSTGRRSKSPSPSPHSSVNMARSIRRGSSDRMGLSPSRSGHATMSALATMSPPGKTGPSLVHPHITQLVTSLSSELTRETEARCRSEGELQSLAKEVKDKSERVIDEVKKMEGEYSRRLDVLKSQIESLQLNVLGVGDAIAEVKGESESRKGELRTLQKDIDKCDNGTYVSDKIDGVVSPLRSKMEHALDTERIDTEIVNPVVSRVDGMLSSCSKGVEELEDRVTKIGNELAALREMKESVTVEEACSVRMGLLSPVADSVELVKLKGIELAKRVKTIEKQLSAEEFRIAQKQLDSEMKKCQKAEKTIEKKMKLLDTRVESIVNAEKSLGRELIKLQNKLKHLRGEKVEIYEVFEDANE